MDRVRNLLKGGDKASKSTGSAGDASTRTSTFDQSLYQLDRSRQHPEQGASQSANRDVSPQSQRAQEVAKLHQDVRQHAATPPPERSLSYFKRTERLIGRTLQAYETSTDPSNQEQIGLYRTFKALEKHRAQASDALFERDYQHTLSGNEFMVHVETNDRDHTHPSPAYTMSAAPDRGIMTIEQAYSERVNDQNKVLPHTVIMRNQWKAVTGNRPEQYSLSLIRDNNVTHGETARIAKECILAAGGSGEFEKGSHGFRRIMRETKLGRGKQRLLEQNTDVFGKKEIYGIVVEDGAGSTLSGIRYLVRDR